MASNRSPRGKLVRRLGLNIFGNPKYDRLLDRKPQGPGKAPKDRRRKVSDYAIQLAEKQKYRIAYGLGERQMRAAYLRASRAPGSTGAALLAGLESSLANAAYRLGWAASRPQARQLVGHGHVMVNDRRVDVPTFALRAGDRLELRAPGALEESARARLGSAPKPPSWLEREESGLSCRVLASPNADEASIPGKIHLVVEFYTR